MAEARVSVNLLEFTCSICLELMNDPVSVPCGHSFCNSCINRHWDREVLNGVYSCPMCKQRFSPRPILGRNAMLDAMVEKLKKTSERTLAGPEDVECDVCIGPKHKAVKSCLVCVASYCPVHFDMHNEMNPGNTHKVTESRYSLKDRICSIHKKVKDVISLNRDEICCQDCINDLYMGHQTITVTNRRHQEQSQIQQIQKEVLQKTRAAVRSIDALKKAIGTIKRSAKASVDQSEKVFAELISAAERKRSEIRWTIKETEEAEVQRAEKILHVLEQEVTELKERDEKLVQLSKVDDDFLFVQTSMSLFNLSKFSDAPQITVNEAPFNEIRHNVLDLEKEVKEFCMHVLNPGSRTDFRQFTVFASTPQISIRGLNPGSRAALNKSHLVQTSVPILREDFLQYFQQLTVDTRTSYRFLQVSDGNRKITYGDKMQSHNNEPERFNYYGQALCREALQDRCYWEVEWEGQQVYVAVSYTGVKRIGCMTYMGFGFNDKSWSLRCNSSQFVLFHNSYKKVVSGPLSRRIGIYLDHRAGILSFYSIADTMKLLHQVRTVFTEPLYGGFWVLDNSSVRLCEKNEKVPPQTIISPVTPVLGGYQFQMEPCSMRG